MADTKDLKSFGAQAPCGFESRRRHLCGHPEILAVEKAGVWFRMTCASTYAAAGKRRMASAHGIRGFAGARVDAGIREAAAGGSRIAEAGAVGRPLGAFIHVAARARHLRPSAGAEFHGNDKEEKTF